MQITKPIVWITPEAWDKLMTYVRASDVECSMLCEVEAKNGKFLINKVYLPKQTRSAAFTKITHEGIVEILSIPGINPAKIKAWFHSHVNMNVTPSGQDISQAKELMQDAEWFIRGILNKRAEYSLFIHWMGIDIEADLQIKNVMTGNIEEAKKELERVTVKETVVFSKSGYPYGGIYGPTGKKEKGKKYNYNGYETFKQGLFMSSPRVYTLPYKDWSLWAPDILNEKMYDIWCTHTTMLSPSSFKWYLMQEAENIDITIEHAVRTLPPRELAGLYEKYIISGDTVDTSDLLQISLFEQYIETLIMTLFPEIAT
jgi:hypothetical protein